MSRNTPETIPQAFAGGTKLEDAYCKGWNHGHGIACHNVPKIGDRIDRSVDYVGCGDRVTAENIREYHEICCHAAADNSRQYSPFEFIASEFNSAVIESYRIELDEAKNNDGDGGQFVVLDGNDEEIETGFGTEAAAQAWIDSQPDSEMLWEAFEAGTGDAIAADLSEYTDEDYGIVAEDDSTTEG